MTGGHRGPRRPPVERVRDQLVPLVGVERAARLPAGYQRLGHVLLVRWPDDLRPYFPLLAEAFARELGVRTVLRFTGPFEGPPRRPAVERLLGSETETEVVEHGIVWRLDAAEIMFARGNKTERARAGTLVGPGETVVDLFAGVGYFAIPAARAPGVREVVAVDRSPRAIHYLRENVRRNGVADRVRILEGDNREVALAPGGADRVFLGYLPSALPWVGRAVPLLRPSGGWLHVHTTAEARRALEDAGAAVAAAVREAGGELAEAPRPRAVKPYGPGRTHVVVDVRAVPRG